MSVSEEIATLGGGCFWCLEAVFQRLKGIRKVKSGYSGGHIKNPSYREVCQKTTGHAEVVQVHFDPTIIGFDNLLEVFWATHNPTTLDRQGNDVGPQYRSAIFYHSEEQRLSAEESKRDVATKIWDDPIVTELAQFETFYEAEPEHDNFYQLNPDYGYCRVIINPKVNKLKASFQHLLIEA